MRLRRHLGLPFCVLLTACATTDGARPDDMSAHEHRQKAKEHRTEAARHAEQYDPNALAHRPTADTGASEDLDAYDGVYIYDHVYNPTDQHRASAERHTQHARDHAAAAATLERFEDQECHAFRPDVRRLCPLLGAGDISVSDIDGGVRLRLADASSTQALYAHIRCHIAYGRAQGRIGMEHCPLYLLNVQASSPSPKTIELTILGRDAGQIQALRYRMKAHVLN